VLPPPGSIVPYLFGTRWPLATLTTTHAVGTGNGVLACPRQSPSPLLRIGTVNSPRVATQHAQLASERRDTGRGRGREIVEPRFAGTSPKTVRMNVRRQGAAVPAGEKGVLKKLFAGGMILARQSIVDQFEAPLRGRARREVLQGQRRHRDVSTNFS
jgi:hypothetical protein